MGVQTEDSTSFRSESPVQPDDPGEMETEMTSETSVFLPESDILSNNGREAKKRLSSNGNLGIIIITSMGNEKSDGINISSSPSVKTIGGKKCAVGDDEEAQKLHVTQNDNAETEKKDTSLEKSRGGCCRNYVGIMLALVSGLVFTIGGVIVKYLRSYHPFTLAIFRFQGILLPSVVMVFYAVYVQKLPIFEPVWPLNQKRKAKRVFGLVLRSGFGTTALLFHFYSLQRLDVADALVIGSCQPVFVTVAAYFFLGEACGIFPVFVALLTMVGVGVISRPPILTGQESFDNDALIGAGFSMASMLSATMVFVIIRYLKDVHVSVLTLFLGCWGTLQTVICSMVIGEFRLPNTLEHWLLALALAGVTLTGQVTMTLALQLEQAGNVAVTRTCDCLFAFLLQFIWLSTVPDLFSLTGAAIIIFCVLLTAFRKWIGTLPKTHPTRIRFQCVMA